MKYATIRLISLLLICISLSACWQSTQLLMSKQQAQTPFPPGKYAPVSPPGKAGDAARTYELKLNGEGYYDVNLDRKLILNNFKHADSRDNLFLFAYGKEGHWSYGLLSVTKDGIYMKRPHCAAYQKEYVAMAIGAGARHSGENCDFPDSKSLDQAMRQFYLHTKGQAGERYGKVP